MTAHSFSSISTWVQCPKKYEETYILKRWKDEGSAASRRGDVIHKELELYLKGERTERPTLEPQGGLLDMLKTVGAEAEPQLAVTRDLQPTGFWSDDAWLRGKLDAVIARMEPLTAWDWKGLALDTRLPTPDGWTTMADVRVGDRLIGADGRPCNVVGKSRVKDMPGFEFTFDDKSSVVCDDEHLWQIDGRGVVPAPEVRLKDRILLAAPLGLPNAKLPIDPYVLGFWLADGKHTSGEITKPDPFVWDEVRRRGFKISHDYSARAGGNKSPVRTVYGLRGVLRKAGLLGNKHIPAAYLRASYEQRLDLLRGLMDGDGNANPTRKQAVFTTTDPKLSWQVRELLLTLGQRVNRCHTTQRGFGLTVGAWPLHFRPLGINPFLLPRKADQIDPAWGPGRSDHRRITGIRRVNVPTQCVAVDSPGNLYLCTEFFIPTHNTGKKRHNDLQADVYHVLLRGTYPKAGKIRIVFDYLEKGRQPPYQPGEGAIERVTGLTDRIEGATAFPPKPSPLCGWCPVKDCQYWEERG